MKKASLKLFFLLVYAALMSACNYGDGSAEKVVRLKTPTGVAVLKIPKDYIRYNSEKDWIVTLDLFYPEMRPGKPRNREENAIIQIVVDKKDPVANFKSLVKGDRYDESKPAATYRVGTDGAYEIFSSVKSPFVARSSGTYYVFKGSDGQNVLVLGSSGLKYSFRRKISDDLIIRYLIPVNQVTDFYEADKVVSEFVAKNI